MRSRVSPTDERRAARHPGEAGEPPVAGGCTMERNLVVIESTPAGWRVVDEAAGSDTFATKAKAIMAAYARASERQERTGRAVAIKMPDGWGGTMVVGAEA